MSGININQFSEALNDKADRDLGNLSNPSGEAHFANPALTNTGYTTNRILEIPQDIKLELNNGLLVRKAGSKFYIPNGFESNGTTPKFDVITLDSDIYCPTSNQNLPKYAQFLNSLDLSDFPRVSITQCFSGTTPPSGYQYMFWYDTVNNIMKLTTNSGSTWYSGFSLPYAITTESVNDGYTSIDQIFNGFGYIGSTVFALPGLEGLIPNGKNEDGTYKTEKSTVSTVNVVTMGNITAVFEAILLYNGVITTVPAGDNKYNSYNNRTGRGGTTFCKGVITSGVISEFVCYSVDSVVNSNEFYQLKDNAVTLTDNQTISGTKTFKNIVYNKVGGTFSNAPANEQVYMRLLGIDSVGRATGIIDSRTGTSGATSTRLIAYNPNDTTKLSVITASVSNSGVAYTSATTPTDTTSTSSSQIATVGWVNSTGNKVVHLDGSETISGQKIFANSFNSQIVFRKTDLATNGTTPSAAKREQLLVIANNDSSLGSVGWAQSSSGDYKGILSATSSVSGQSHTAEINVVALSNGATYATAPTPTDTISTSSEQIATVGWVNTVNKTGNGIGAPNYSAAVDITINSSTPYTATENGFIVLSGSTSSYSDLKIDNSVVWRITSSSGVTPAIIPIAKGSVCTVDQNLAISFVKFAPCK